MSKEEREKRLRELHKHSHESFDEFTNFDTEDGVIDATELFNAKKKHDSWWEQALRRLNAIIRGERDDV